MPLALTTEQVENYHRDGFASPLRILSEEQAGEFRARFEAYEKANGGWYELSKGQKLYLLQTWVAELVRNTKVLDGVQDVLGPNILCWGCSLFVKEARHPGYVSWHQDSTYWGLSKPDVVTAWIALSPANELSGCMKMLPGSHKQQQMPHHDTLAENNLLTRGQEIAVEVDESQARLLPLQPGEMSLHNIRTVHASEPNRSDDRRIGVAIRYITPQVQQIEAPKDSAWLVRGDDDTGNWIHETPPSRDMDDDAMREHERIMSIRQGVLYKNVGGQPAHTKLDTP